MGYLISKIFQGIVWIILTVIEGFLGYMDICDAVLTTFAIMVFMSVKFDWSNWWGIALGLAVSLVIYIIFKHRIGFFIVSVFYSALWGWMLVDLARLFWFKGMSDMWYWIWIAVIFVFLFGSHHAAYFRKEVEADIAAEEAARAGR